MIVSIHQPDYIPWLGLYYKMAHSDVFVYLDDAQYSNEADHNVNKIKTPQGEFRLKVPVEQHLSLIHIWKGIQSGVEIRWNPVLYPPYFNRCCCIFCIPAAGIHSSNRTDYVCKNAFSDLRKPAGFFVIAYVLPLCL